MNRIRATGVSKRILRSSSAGIISQFEDQIRSIQGDINQIASEYNSEVYPVLDALPKGSADPRWRLPRELSAKTGGLTGAFIFVDDEASVTSDGGRFWDEVNLRPKTVKETLNSIYADISNLLLSVRTEAIEVGIDPAILARINANEVRSNNNQANILQLAKDLYDETLYSLDNDGDPNLNLFSVRDMVHALLSFHGGGWNSSITLSHGPYPTAPVIVVGNEGNGDTADLCHFLDIGNGAQLKAAIESADAGKDVYIRPGTYDFGVAGGPSSRISVPADVRVRGAGRSHTTISTRAAGGDGRAFTLGQGASIEDFRVYCPTPTANQTGGYEIILAGTDDNSLIRIDIEFEGRWSTIGDARWAAVTRGISIYGARPLLQDCQIINGPQLYDLPWGPYFYGLYCYGVEYGTFRGIHTTGLDRTFYYTNGWRSDFSDMKFLDFRYIGAIFDYSESDNVRGITLRSDGLGGPVFGFQIIDCQYQSFADISFMNGDAGGTAIWAEYVCNCYFNGCRGDGSWGNYFLKLDHSSHYNIIIGNQFNGNAVSDSGTGNDITHNQL